MSTEPEDPDPSTDRRSILAPDGTVDDDRAPDLPDDLLRRMYRAMPLARRFDERRLHLQRAGEIGTFAPVNGQEAAQVGAARVLGVEIVGRDAEALIAEGETAELFLGGSPHLAPRGSDA